MLYSLWINCRELGKKILKGEAKRSDCVISDTNTKLYINSKEIDMVPFVQSILYNAVQGVVSEIDGYHKGVDIKIEIDKKNR